jgi:hypothetical protein
MALIARIIGLTWLTSGAAQVLGSPSLGRAAIGSASPSCLHVSERSSGRLREPREKTLRLFGKNLRFEKTRH